MFGRARLRQRLFLSGVLPLKQNIHKSFKPAWWLRNPHCQTLWQKLVRNAPSIKTVRERLELPDGDFIDLSWTVHKNSSPTTPIVIILHGLQGSINSKYVRGILHVIERLGWRAVLMHFRGCSGEPNRLERCYHAGETTDITSLISMLRQREPHAPLAAIGFSLGGNVLLKWLGELGGLAPLWAAVAVSPPFSLSNAVLRLSQGFSRFYEKRMLRCMRETVRTKFKDITCPIDYGDLDQLLSLRDYDDKITAPLHGYIDADDYYLQCSSRRYLKGIRIPTLILHAADDPFMTLEGVPSPGELSDAITFELSRHGGHIGFVMGSYPWKPHYWLESRIPAYLEATLKARTPAMVAAPPTADR